MRWTFWIASNSSSNWNVNLWDGLYFNIVSLKPPKKICSIIILLCCFQEINLIVLRFWWKNYHVDILALLNFTQFDHFTFQWNWKSDYVKFKSAANFSGSTNKKEKRKIWTEPNTIWNMRWLHVAVFVSVYLFLLSFTCTIDVFPFTISIFCICICVCYCCLLKYLPCAFVFCVCVFSLV